MADTLSQACLDDSTTEIPEKKLDFVVHSVIDNLPLSDPRREQFKRETAQDANFQLLAKCFMNGWPEVKELVLNELRPYFNFRESITFSRGLLLKAEQLVIPSSLRKEMCALVH